RAGGDQRVGGALAGGGDHDRPERRWDQPDRILLMELSHTSATTGSPDEQRHPGERHRRLGRAGDVALTVLAAAGALCILLVLAAVLFDVTLIMFSTGSMAPTIPEGSVAVVHQIPAAQIEVGDI